MSDSNLRRYDTIFRDIARALRDDYAGWAEIGSEYDAKFYLTACGTAHHNGQMTDLTMLRYVSQMLATTFDRSLRFELRESEDYTPGTRGFFARRFGDDLVVTHAPEEDRLSPGDVICGINGASAARHRAGLQKNVFYSDTPERELWSGFLKMADHISVRHPDGSREELSLRSFPNVLRTPNPTLRVLEPGVVYLSPDYLDGAALEALLEARGDEISGSRRLILDLRAASGDDPSAIAPILPYLFQGMRRADRIVPDEPLLTNYTQRNCEWKAYLLECAGDDSGWPDRLRQRAGDGWTEESLCFWENPEEMLEGRGPERVILLTDTWCEGAAERLAETAMRLGAVSVGRPTMGTLDYCNPVTVLCDSDFAVTWPMSKRKAAGEGRAVKGRGIPVSVYIPFTPEETVRDPILERALTL